MRIAIFPAVTIKRGVESASDFLALHPSYFDYRDDVFFYYILPSDLKDYVEDYDNVKYLFYDLPSELFYYNILYVPVKEILEWFNPLGYSKYAVDVFWTNKTPAAWYIRAVLRDPYAKFSVPVITEEFQPMLEDKSTAYFGDRYDSINRALSYSLSYTIFNSEYDRRLCERQVKTYLSSFMAEQFYKKYIISPAPINVEMLEKAEPRYRDEDGKGIVLFGARWNQQKRFDIVLKIMKELHKIKPDRQYWITSPKEETSSMKKIKGDKELSFLKVRTLLPYYEWYNYIVSADLTVYASEFEAFTVGALEMLYGSKAMLLPNKPWVEGILPEHYDKYPLMFNSVKEAVELGAWALENIEYVDKKLNPIREWIKRNYGDKKKLGDERLNFFDTIVKESKKFIMTKISNSVKELFDATVKNLPKRFTVQMFLNKMEDVARSFKIENMTVASSKRKMISTMYVYLYLSERDDLREIMVEVPTFEKVK